MQKWMSFRTDQPQNKWDCLPKYGLIEAYIHEYGTNFRKAVHGKEQV